MATDTHDFTLTAVLVGGEEDDAGSVARSVQEISGRWRAIGVPQPTPTVAAPEGARSGEVAVFGAFCASFLPMLPDLLAALRSVIEWAGARPGRTAKVIRPDGSSIEIAGLSRADQHALVQSWIDEHSGDGPAGGA